MDDRASGKSQSAAAAKVGISERTGCRSEHEDAGRYRPRHRRARYGPKKEVAFPHSHQPGQRPLSDLTQPKGTALAIGGAVLTHVLDHFRMAFTGRYHARLMLGCESFAALAEGRAESLAQLCRVPVEARINNLSAAYRNLDRAAQGDVTERYPALCYR